MDEDLIWRADQLSALYCHEQPRQGLLLWLGLPCPALVLQSLVTPPPQATDLDHKEALAFLTYLLCGSMVGHDVVHVSLIKNNSFAVWPFPLLQNAGSVTFQCYPAFKNVNNKREGKVVSVWRLSRGCSEL